MLRIRKINIITVAVCNPFSAMGSVQVGSQGNGLSAKRPPQKPRKIRHRNNFFAFAFYEEPEIQKDKGSRGGFASSKLTTRPISPRATHKFTC